MRNNQVEKAYVASKRVQTVSIDQPVEGEDGGSMSFDLRDLEADPSESVVLQQRKRYLKMALDRIPEKYRMLIEYRYFQELSYEEVATASGLPLGTVKAQLFRARELLNLEMKNVEDQI